LVLSTSPSNTADGSTLTSMTVSQADSQGNTVSTSGVSISAAIQTNPGTSTLSGTTPRTTTSGVSAAFNDLSLNKIGNGYALRFSDGTRTVDTSSFNITANVPT